MYLGSKQYCAIMEMGLVNKHRMVIYISWNMAKQSRMASKSTNQSIGREFTYVGPPTRAHFILPESILITLLFGITELDSLLISKRFKNRGSMKICLPEMKVAAKLY